MGMTAADMRDTVLVSLGCLIAALAVLGLPFLGVPLCAMALAWLTYRRGMLVAWIVIAAAAVVAASQGPIEGLLTAAVLVVAGPIAARVLQKREPWLLVGAIALVVLAATLGAYALAATAQHTDLLGLMRSQGDQILASLRATASGSSPAQLAVIEQNVREAFYQWPAWFVVEAVASGLLAVYAVGWQARRAGIEDAHALPPLDRLDLSWHLTWGVIAGFALLAASRFTHQPDGVTAVLGLNVMRVTGTLLAVQGLAVFAGLYRKAGMGRIARGVGFTFLAVTEPLTAVFVPVGLVGLTGLLDLWINLRKLPRGGEPQPAEAVEPPAGDE